LITSILKKIPATILLSDTNKIAITGLSRAGKTLFITSLIDQLLHQNRLSSIRASTSPFKVTIKPPLSNIKRFDYYTLIDTLKNGHIWPNSTDEISHIVLKFESKSRFSFLGSSTFTIELIDYPGEWLLDLTLLKLNYREWSEKSISWLKSIDDTKAKEYLQTIASLNENTFDKEVQERLYTQYKELLIHNPGTTLKYSDGNEEYLVHSKYIKELNLYLIVQAKVSDFTSGVLETFYLNLLTTLLVTLIIILLIYKMINRHSAKLEKFANYDELTQIQNRRVFDENLQQTLLINGRKPVKNSILFLDVDDFKKINDSFGHEVGDKVLIRLAKVLKESVREMDLVCRWGGEEFIISLVDASLEDSKKIAEKIRVNIESDSLLNAYIHYSVTASFGLTQIQERDTLEKILQRVDNALYTAKEEGKNRVSLG